MEKDDLFLFSLTFITGVFLGAYIYTTAFKPVYEPEDIKSGEISASEFSVIGQTYGGFNESGYIHPSFRLLGNGSYNYVRGGVGESALGVKEGNLARDVFLQLKRQLENSDLDYLSQKNSSKTCRYAADGIEYKYTVVFDGETYRLDTCTTNFDFEDDLFETLDNVWSEVKGSGSSFSGEGSVEWLSRKLNELLYRN